MSEESQDVVAELQRHVNALRDGVARARRLAASVGDKLTIGRLKQHAEELDHEARELEAEIAKLKQGSTLAND
jgi:hypothetical protein